MSVTSVACAVLTLGLWLLPTRPRWPATPVNRAALGWLAALLASATFAVDPSASAMRLGKALFPALVPLAVFHTPDGRAGRRALAVLLASSACASLLGSAFFIVQGASMAARARGPSGHYMTFGGQLLLLVSVAAAVALCARERRWRIGASVTAAIGLFALAGTFTRSAWLGTAVALTGIVAGARPRRLPILLAVLVGLYVLAPAAWRDRMHSAFDPHHPANIERTHMWEAGLRMLRDRPVTGVGLQDLHPIYEKYRSPDAVEGAGHLHSVPVHIAATMGVLGLAAFAWLVWALFAAAASGLRPMLRSGGVEAGLRLGVTAGLAGFLVAGLFEWNFGDEELLYLLYALVGLAWSARSWNRGEAPGR